MNFTTQFVNITEGWNSSTDAEYRDELFDKIYQAVRNLQALVTILGNLLTIFVIVKFKRLHSVSNVLITSLAVADLFTGVSTPSGTVGYVMKRSVKKLLQVGPTLFEYAQFEIEVHLNCFQNNTHISSVLNCMLDSKFAEFKDLYLVLFV